MFDINSIIGLAFWAVINYFVAHQVVKRNPEFNINPILYGLGAMTFGGIFPLIFLGLKYLWFKSNNKNNKNNEMEELRRRLNELENKNE